MIYSPKAALKICFEAHKEQVDKSGMPYVFHPFHLAEQMEDEKTTIVALLHDTIEDTDYTFDDLIKLGFEDDVTEVLKLITHVDDVPYMEYIAKIKDNPIARKVKLADLRHNIDLSRLEVVDEKALNRKEKYVQAIAFLKD